jgi:hypothetical protein
MCRNPADWSWECSSATEPVLSLQKLSARKKKKNATNFYMLILDLTTLLHLFASSNRLFIAFFKNF